MPQALPAPPPSDGPVTTPSLRTLGTGHLQAVSGDDARLATQTITLTGDVTGSGTGTFATTLATVTINKGGTNATTAAGARTNLGLVIGTDVQAHSAALDAVTGTNTGDQTITLTGDVTGSGTGSFATTLATVTINKGGTNATTAAGARTNLGLVIGTDVQAHSANLDSSTAAGAALLQAANAAAQRSALGLGTLATQSGTFSGTSSGTNTGDQTPSSLGLVIGTNVQAWSAALDTVASGITSFGQSVIAAANAAAERTVLGLGTLATQSGTFSGTSSGTNTGDQTITLTGDVTGSGTGSFATTLAAVANSKLATMPALTLKGNNTGGSSTPLDLTVAQVNLILPAFTSSLNGLAPLSGGGSTNYLRADGTWAAPAGTAGITALTGDVTATGPGSAVATLATVTVAKGGTGATSFTTGSVVFMGASAFSEDNANAFWSTTNSQLILGPRIGVIAAAFPGAALRLSNAGVSTTSYDIGRDSAVGQLKFYGNRAGDDSYLFTGASGDKLAISTGGQFIRSLSGETTSKVTSAPATPSATFVITWVDSTSKNFASKDDAGNVNHGVRTRTAVSSNWIRSIADDGTAAISQPVAGDISGLGTLATQNGTFSGTSSGTNTGDQTITLTGDVTGSGTGSFAATIAAGVVSNSKLANMATGTYKGNATGGSAAPTDIAVPANLRVTISNGTQFTSSANFTFDDASSTSPGLTVAHRINQKDGGSLTLTSGTLFMGGANFGHFTGTAFINRIDQAGWTSGSSIKILLNASGGDINVPYNLGTSGTARGIITRDQNNIVVKSGKTYLLELMYEGTNNTAWTQTDGVRVKDGGALTNTGGTIAMNDGTTYGTWTGTTNITRVDTTGFNSGDRVTFMIVASGADVTIVYGTAASGAAKGIVPKYYNGDSITVVNGDRYELDLIYDSTTGFWWQIGGSGKADLTYIKNKIPGVLLGVQHLTSGSGATYTPTAGTTSIIVKTRGGGGGGGGAQSTTGTAGVGSGGGQGGEIYGYWPNWFGTGTYTVGTGGAGGPGGFGGSDGQDTTFTDGTITLAGRHGTGGNNDAGGTAANINGAGAGGIGEFSGSLSGFVAFDSKTGFNGDYGLRFVNTGLTGQFVSGRGAGPGGGAARVTAANGANGNTDGAGGSGAAATGVAGSTTGGNGFLGDITIWEYGQVQ